MTFTPNRIDEPRISRGHRASGRAPRVLVVEDEHDIAVLVKHTLERAGDAEVELVASGDVAIRVATEDPPDLIVLDLNLPVISALKCAACGARGRRPRASGSSC
jgi:CheY-like chemotaxis protein